MPPPRFLLLAVAASATRQAPAAPPAPAEGLAAVPQTLPHVAEVMLALCGVVGFTHQSSSQCHHHIFGFALAWTECSYRHLDDEQGFGACIQGCATRDGLCARACAGGVLSLNTTQQQCLDQCAAVAECVQEAAQAAGTQADASEAAGNCLVSLQTQPPGTAGVPVTPPVLLAARASHGASVLRAEQPASNLCSCDVTGTVMGVETGQAGCARHGQEPQAMGEQYCFVEGGAQCNNAKLSTAFPGLYWGFCVTPTTQAPVPPQPQAQGFASGPLAGLAGCELDMTPGTSGPPLRSVVHQELEPFQPPAGPNISSVYMTQVDQMLQDFEQWSTTIQPPGIGQIVRTLFGAAEDQPPPLPPALLTPPAPQQVATATMPPSQPSPQQQSRLRRQQTAQAGGGLPSVDRW